MTRSRTSRASRVFAAGPALAGLALAACLCGCEARYYGRYRSYGGTAVVRTTTVAVRPRGRWGRKLLQADYDYTGDYAQPPLASALEAPTPAPEEEVDDTEERTCQTVLDVLRSRPELSLLTEALEDLPRVRAALDNPTRTDTFFAPTNDAMEKLLAWGDFVEKAEGIDEMLGDVPLKALIIAYHAIPNATLFSPALAAKGGDASTDRFLDTALAKVLEDPGLEGVSGGSSSEPLEIDEFEGKIFVKGVGSEAKVVTADIKACASVVHLIDHVLLPIDGDAELEPFQTRRLEAIKKRAEAARKKKAEADEEEDDEALAPSSPYGDVLDEEDAPAPAPAEGKKAKKVKKVKKAD